MFLPTGELNRSRFWAYVICCLTCASTLASTKNAWFTRVWNTGDGLGNNQVDAIVQSRDNFLWVVLPTELMRFDGVRFSRFPLETYSGPIDNDLYAALYDRKGVLWLTTFGGTVLGLKPNFSVVTIRNTRLPDGMPPKLAEDETGALWLGYPGVICQVKNGQVTRFGSKEGVPPGRCFSLICDGAGDVWLAKGNKICVFRNGHFHRIAVSGKPRCLAATPTNAVWFVASGHLQTCDTSGEVRDYGAFPGLFRASCSALLEDRTGAVWIGTDGNGLIRYSKSGFERVKVSFPYILCLAQDNEGNIWAGTGGGGLDRISLSAVRLETLESKPALEQVESICQDSNGRLWGTAYNGWPYHGELISRANGRWIPVFTNSPFARTVTCVAAGRRGGVWVGTMDGKILRLVNTNSLTLVQNTSHGIVYALLPASNGDLWIVNYRTLQCLHDGQLRKVKVPRKVKRISAIAEDAAGNIWVGAKGIVMRFDGKHFVDETSHLPIAGRWIHCLYATPDGSLWISGSGLGLLRLKDGQVGQIGSEQGLPDDYLSQIVADGRGWLWFAGDRGIFKVRQRELESAMEDHKIHLRPVVYGRNEGLPNLAALASIGSPFAFPRALCTRNGRVWLLTHTGVVVANPKVLPANSAPPPVLLTRVAMDGRSIAAYGVVTPTQTVANLALLNAPLLLPPAYRHLEFDYTAFHFRAPKNLHFRYQLAGFDNSWIDGHAERHADYSRLPAGNYQFKVEASVGDGPWSKAPAVLAFTVMPFFWQTWWFRLGLLMFFASAGIAFVRYICVWRLEAKMRRLEQRAVLDRERTRIACDLHDDLGCSLNKIALTMEAMQRGPAASEPEKVRQCWNMVREVAGSVDDIVWAMNPRNDKLCYLVDYLCHFATEFFQAADIPCLLELPEHLSDRTVSPELRHNLLLAVKEALNNVVRHAGASEVRLHVTASENQVAIVIEDNGCGFAHPPDNATCDGLRNMRLRMEEIGGQFQLASQPSAGTRVTFLYTWPRGNGR